jgi:hypothetical protein
MAIQQEYDPFARPIPGESLTDAPLGDRAWEGPPRNTDPDKVINDIVKKLENPENLDPLLDAINAGVPVETIINTWAIEGFSRGEFTPDVAELVKPVFALFLIHKALEKGIVVRMFNEDVESKDTAHFEGTLGIMKNARPALFEQIEKEFAADEKSLPEAIEPPQESKGFIERRVS